MRPAATFRRLNTGGSFIIIHRGWSHVHDWFLSPFSPEPRRFHHPDHQEELQDEHDEYRGGYDQKPSQYSRIVWEP
ncbi:hypothetical protein FOZ60_011469 [Perkinsus olseni]|uniref:Uncharacterized protein n=1 Tax=Perkinsus olseni TaxID=32597 RepID=A0A7J6PAP4_PEROL|nr:hypothetical protein FOZ60_011469 [Perkinsus olseni]